MSTIKNSISMIGIFICTGKKLICKGEKNDLKKYSHSHVLGHFMSSGSILEIYPTAPPWILTQFSI